MFPSFFFPRQRGRSLPDCVVFDRLTPLFRPLKVHFQILQLAGFLVARARRPPPALPITAARIPAVQETRAERGLDAAFRRAELRWRVEREEEGGKGREAAPPRDAREAADRASEGGGGGEPRVVRRPSVVGIFQRGRWFSSKADVGSDGDRDRPNPGRIGIRESGPSLHAQKTWIVLTNLIQ